jgi:DNA-binding transcriptional LysR family regulator
MEYQSLPDLKGLAALRAVVELGGVEQAGQFLHIGQPAVTKRLRALEECYGTPLMQRKGRKLELTAAGDRVYAFARIALDYQSSLLEDLQNLISGQKDLRLETTLSIGEYLLPDILLSFSDKYPDYRIHSRMGYSRRIQTRVATGLSDIALIELEPQHPDLLVQKWLEDELILVAAPNHPFSKAEAISLNQLSEQNFVLREPQASSRIILDKALRDAGIINLPISIEAGSTDTIIEILSRGRHLSFLPQFTVRDAVKNGLLCRIQVEQLKINTRLWIARNVSSISNPVAEAFIQILRNHS